MHDPVRRVLRWVWRNDRPSEGERVIPEETALALTYNGSSYVVMMGSPQDLRDFAVGFSLSERIIQSESEIESFEEVAFDGGIELRIWLAQSNADRLHERRRFLAGPTGCGLCGVESIAEALRETPVVGSSRQFSPQQIMSAVHGVGPLQKINIETRAVHAAAFWMPESGIVSLREDVGRHNALDKLIGALARDSVAARDGVLLLTSRVSVELVQKAAAAGLPVIVAVSTPTALAVRVAEAAGVTLVAIARADGFEVFTHPQRIDASFVGCEPAAHRPRPQE